MNAALPEEPDEAAHGRAGKKRRQHRHPKPDRPDGERAGRSKQQRVARCTWGMHHAEFETRRADLTGVEPKVRGGGEREKHHERRPADRKSEPHPQIVEHTGVLSKRCNP